MNTYGIFNADGTLRTFRTGTKKEAQAACDKIARKLGIKLSVRKV